MKKAFKTIEKDKVTNKIRELRLIRYTLCPYSCTDPDDFRVCSEGDIIKTGNFFKTYVGNPGQLRNDYPEIYNKWPPDFDEFNMWLFDYCFVDFSNKIIFQENKKQMESV